jgi:hypothetical protein
VYPGGSEPKGDYVYTPQMIDKASGQQPVGGLLRERAASDADGPAAPTRGDILLSFHLRLLEVKLLLLGRVVPYDFLLSQESEKGLYRIDFAIATGAAQPSPLQFARIQLKISQSQLEKLRLSPCLKEVSQFCQVVGILLRVRCATRRSAIPTVRKKTNPSCIVCTTSRSSHTGSGTPASSIHPPVHLMNR